MHVVLVMFAARAGRAPAFRAAVLAQAATSLALEPGCRVFEVSSPAGRENEFLLYEVYDDEAAFRAHLATAHFRDFDRETRPMVESKTVRTFALLSPLRGE